jgi:hypothetical protein
MELLPDGLRARLPPISAIDDEDEPYVFIRYTLSGTAQDWYVMAGEPQGGDFVFWGFVRHESRFACFRLSELEGVRGPSGQSVVRDKDFTEGGLSEVVPARPISDRRRGILRPEIFSGLFFYPPYTSWFYSF